MMQERLRTHDRGPSPPDGFAMQGSMQLGPKREMLPNGTLLCRDVPIARTGWMLYGAGEIPLEPDSRGVIYVQRTADELFNPEVITSFMGAPVVRGHMDVTDDNRATVTKGITTTNVRRGTGDDADVLLADLLVTDPALIRAINEEGLREVSAGYDASYRQTGEGVGVQYQIRANHIALVERGRCGPRCAIGDQAPPIHQRKEDDMTTTKKSVPRRTLDAQALASLGITAAANAMHAATTGEGPEDSEEDGEDGAVHVHVHTGDAAPPRKEAEACDEDRLTQIEKSVAGLQGTVESIGASVMQIGTALQAMNSGRAKTGDEADEAAQTATEGDSKALATSFQGVAAQCEILVPGFRMPTFDAALPRARTVDRMCAQRRRALDLFSATKDGAACIAAIAPDFDMETADCATTAVVFNAAAAARAAENNRAATGDASRPGARSGDGKPAPVTIEGIADAHKKFWSSQA
jgi:hypothetical protein